MKEAPGIVLDALNVGMLMMNRSPEDEVQKAILEFVTHYGLLGPDDSAAHHAVLHGL